MPDEMDLIQERVLKEQMALEQQRRFNPTVPVPVRNGAVYCCACGEPIDPRRVQAMAGVERCLGCQAMAERKMGYRI